MKKHKNVWPLIILMFVVFLNGCYDEEDPAPGFVSGTVIDAVTRNTLSNVSIAVADQNNNPIVTETTDTQGRFYISLETDPTYTLTFTRTGHQPSQYYGIQVLSNEETVLEAVLQIDDSVTGVGSISGQITDAVSGLAINAATLLFRPGINVQTGSVSAETSTDILGNYTLMDTLPTGVYTCEISLLGYTTNYSTVLVLGGQLVANQNSTITSPPGAGETRIVLTWGASPSDLDSHLTGPISDNSTERFHIYFANQKSHPVQPSAVLDLDDVSSYGPETITIKTQHIGLYRYSVHDFTNLSSTVSTALANSSAKVTVYQGNTSPRIFNVPNGVGNLWTVFTLDGSSLTLVNTLSNSGSSTVQAINAVSNATDDSELMIDLPNK